VLKTERLCHFFPHHRSQLEHAHQFFTIEETEMVGAASAVAYVVVSLAKVGSQITGDFFEYEFADLIVGDHLFKEAGVPILEVIAVKAKNRKSVGGCLAADNFAI
jgi:hypothetical protein